LISFAWTTAALLAGAKCRTRRGWNDAYARKFIAAYWNGDSVAAWDRLPQAHGRKIAEIILTREPFKQRTSQMTEQDYIAEGLAWMESKHLLIKGMLPRQFFEAWKALDDLLWVIDFKLRGNDDSKV
jgi:hypothetical protein